MLSSCFCLQVPTVSYYRVGFSPVCPAGGSGTLLLTEADELINPHFPPMSERILSSQHCNRDMSLSYAVLTLTWYASSLVYGMIKYLCVCVCVCGGGYVSMSVGEKKQVVKGPSLFPLPLLTPLSMRTLLPCVFLGWSCMCVCVAVVSWALPPCPDY